MFQKKIEVIATLIHILSQYSYYFSPIPSALRPSIKYVRKDVKKIYQGLRNIFWIFPGTFPENFVHLLNR